MVMRSRRLSTSLVHDVLQVQKARDDILTIASKRSVYPEKSPYYCPHVRPKSKVFNCLLKGALTPRPSYCEADHSAGRGRRWQNCDPILAVSSRLSQANGVVCRVECASRSIADSELTPVHGELPMHRLVGEQFEDDALGHQ